MLCKICDAFDLAESTEFAHTCKNIPTVHIQFNDFGLDFHQETFFNSFYSVYQLSIGNAALLFDKSDRLQL